MLLGIPQSILKRERWAIRVCFLTNPTLNDPECLNLRSILGFMKIWLGLVEA